MVAYKLGDPTAKYAGRLTLNPLVHIDPIGTLFLPGFLVLLNSPVVLGWAKPVPVNFSNLYHPKRDMIWVGLAGPAANIALAILFSWLIRLPVIAQSAGLSSLCALAVLINLVLAVFNAVPIPPLDGSRILTGLLPPRQARILLALEPFGFLILILLVWLKVLDRVVWPIVLFLASLLGVQV